MAALLMLCSLVGKAQTSKTKTAVYTVYPETIKVNGDFNKGSGDTAVKNAPISYFPSYTVGDSCYSSGATANDSARNTVFDWVGNYSVEIHLKRGGSVAIDSAKIYIWGTNTEGNGQGQFALLKTFSVANVSTEQNFIYNPRYELGYCPKTIRVTAKSGNLVANSKFWWKAWWTPY